MSILNLSVYQAIKSGLTVRYRSIFDVVRDFMRDEAFAGQDKVMDKYLKPDLLIIDAFFAPSPSTFGRRAKGKGAKNADYVAAETAEPSIKTSQDVCNLFVK